jgi:ABC-2 type transport system ATP-binding protein
MLAALFYILEQYSMSENDMNTAVAKQPALIQTHNLSKKFGEETAVQDLNLTIPQGAIFGFIGPSGCGKTTTMRLLLGIYDPTEGEATIFDQSPQTFGRAERERIGYMPQLFVLYPDLTVWENLNFAASLYGFPLRRKERLQELLDLVELRGHEKKLVRNISGGMQRRLSLAAALVHNPDLLFLDEPTAGIDPVLRRKFWDYFQQLQAEGHTLFITTQYVGEAAYCDYVGVMVNGRLLMVETPEGLRDRALGGDIIHLRPSQALSYEQFDQLCYLPFVKDGQVTRLRDRLVEILVEDASQSLPRLLSWCEEQNIPVETANEYVPPFDDVFVKLVQEETGDAA